MSFLKQCIWKLNEIWETLNFCSPLFKGVKILLLHSVVIVSDLDEKEKVKKKENKFKSLQVTDPF